MNRYALANRELWGAWTDITGNYADRSAQVTATEYAFVHSLETIVMALLDAGLRLDELREHEHVPWQAFPFMIERASLPLRKLSSGGRTRCRVHAQCQ